MGVATARTVQWADRHGDAPVGTIERVARFAFLDGAGGDHDRYRTRIDSATEAAESIREGMCGPDDGPRLAHPVLFAAATTMLAIDAVLVGGALLLVL